MRQSESERSKEIHRNRKRKGDVCLLMGCHELTPEKIKEWKNSIFVEIEGANEK